MRALAFWQIVTADEAGLLEQLVGLLRDEGIRFCVLGGQAVNAYAEPVVSLDLDLVIASEQLARLESLLARRFRIDHFPHSVTVSAPDSDLRIQLQTDARYAPFVERAEPGEILGLRLPVARVEDVLQGKVWAALDATRRASKRQKDLADIARLLEAYPHLRGSVPDEVLQRLV